MPRYIPPLGFPFFFSRPLCKIVNDDSAVERTLDSGRYFVLKIANDKGQHAFIGIAFNERNDAFDFNIALSEFKAECERETQAKKSSTCTQHTFTFLI